MYTHVVDTHPEPVDVQRKDDPEQKVEEEIAGHVEAEWTVVERVVTGRVQHLRREPVEPADEPATSSSQYRVLRSSQYECVDRHNTRVLSQYECVVTIRVLSRACTTQPQHYSIVNLIVKSV